MTQAIQTLPDRLGLPLLQGMASWLSGPRRQRRLSILIYHRVLEQPDPLIPGLPDARQFRWQMALLSRHFRVLPLSEAVERLGRNALPPRAACITFDDGYEDNARVALPILRELGLPATFFIATGFLDGGRMWNDTVIETLRRLPAGELDLEDLGLGRLEVGQTPQARVAAVDTLLGRLKYLEPGERLARVQALGQRVEGLPDDLMLTCAGVRELFDAGMEIGGHTVNHPILTRLETDQARREIADGRQRLAQLIRAPVELFAYPNGRPGQDYDGRHVALVRELGFKAAVSTAWGVSTPGTDPWQLRRFTPWDDTPLRFMARLLWNYRQGVSGQAAAC